MTPVLDSAGIHFRNSVPKPEIQTLNPLPKAAGLMAGSPLLCESPSLGDHGSLQFEGFFGCRGSQKRGPYNLEEHWAGRTKAAVGMSSSSGVLPIES